MEKLPTEIMLDILSRLPYETIINCKLVCKPLRDVTNIIKVGFIFQQLGKSGFKLCYGGDKKYDDITMHGNYSCETLMEINNHPSAEKQPPLSDMVGSSNGLVCLWIKDKSSYARDPIYICNPITNEYVYLPTFNNYNKTCNSVTKGYFHYGFGYHHPTDKYKVVRIYYHDFKLNEYSTICGQVQAYTLGSGHGWRDIGRLNYDLAYYSSVCANGALHVAFDLADEEFRLIPYPPLSPKRSYDVVSLKLMFEGYLCVVHVDVGKEDAFIHVWALEKKKKFSSSYDAGEHDLRGWSKKFSIPCTKDVTYFPFAVTKSNQVLMRSDGTIFCYDLGTKVLRKLCDDCPMRNNLTIPHVNSLVSLEALGEKSKRRKWFCECVQIQLHAHF